MTKKTPEQITQELSERNKTEDGPRAWTEEEMRDKILSHIWSLVDYWNRDDLPVTEDRRDRLGGLAFSILSMLDGCTLDIPGIDLTFCPHPDDKEYHIERGENWVEGGMRLNFSLHDFFHKLDPQRE